MADLEKVAQKLSLMDKDPIGSFNGKLYLNTRFFFVKIDCQSLENLQSVDDADFCIDFLQRELSDLEIYFKYDIGIKPEYKKELSELNPDVFIELEKRETANALKTAISRYERRRQDLQNNLSPAPITEDAERNLKKLYAMYPIFEKQKDILIKFEVMKKTANGFQWLYSKASLAEYFQNMDLSKDADWKIIEPFYKQAGNAIVKQVLMAIFSKML